MLCFLARCLCRFADLATVVELHRLQELLRAVTGEDFEHSSEAISEWHRAKTERLRTALAHDEARPEDVAALEHLITETMRAVPGLQFVSNGETGRDAQRSRVPVRPLLLLLAAVGAYAYSSRMDTSATTWDRNVVRLGAGTLMSLATVWSATGARTDRSSR